MKQRRIKWVLLIAALASAIALTACSNNDNGGEQLPPAGNETAQNGGSGSGNAAGETTPAPEEDQLVRAAGTYIGQIDPHSIEIETDGQPVAYQLAEGLESVIETLNPEQAVTFEYVEQPVEGDDALVQRVIMQIAPSSGDAEAPADNDQVDAEPSGKLPGTKKIAVEIEGDKEEREAQAAVADGYTIYVFEQFAFDPASNRLSMNVDNEYYVDIAKLPDGTDASELRKEGEAWLKDLGEIAERKGDELHATMRGASLFLIASSDSLTRQYIVKEIDGAAYAFKINMPHREASEGFGPLAYASLNAIVSDK